MQAPTTTVAPATDALTTVAPVTAAPTTLSLATAAPTTAAPTAGTSEEVCAAGPSISNA